MDVLLYPSFDRKQVLNFNPEELAMDPALDREEMFGAHEDSMTEEQTMQVDWLGPAAGGVGVRLEELRTAERLPWRQRLLLGDEVLRQTQKYFYRILRAARWATGNSWRLAQAKLKKQWKDHLNLAEFRHSCEMVGALAPKVKYARLDLAHNCWVTGGRRQRTPLLLTADSFVGKTQGQSEKLRLRAAQTKDNNLKFDRDCIFCGKPSADDTRHYFQWGGGCEALKLRARAKGILGE